MAIRDLRGFLAALERRGELLHVTEELSPRFEIPQVLKELDRPGAPAVQFERVRGYEARIVGNLLGTT
ncbi:MAG: UbiD family decarboxylase, partial [Deltaproteobacteria bacterium]|nr:UbiD family decarboxylase [Deltaproteobacteria bacterium]